MDTTADTGVAGGEGTPSTTTSGQERAYDWDWVESTIVDDGQGNDDDDDDDATASARRKHVDVLKKLLEADLRLPVGWKKNPDAHMVRGDAGAPFIHEDGRVSWKNPAREQMMDIISRAMSDGEREGQSPVMETSTTTPGTAMSSQKARSMSATERRLMKKYRMMIKGGVPLKAVENTARLDGVDPALITTSSVPDNSGRGGGEGASPPKTAMADMLTKKYRRMLKSNVPSCAVKSMAGLEMGLIGTELDDFMDELFSGTVVSEKKSSALVTSEGPADRDVGNKERKDVTVPFTPRDDGKVEFALFRSSVDGSITSQEAHLTLLVRKMTLTVKKGGVASSCAVHGGGDSIMLIAKLDLYQVLGSLRGVQFARDVYNSTCNSDTMSESEVRSKRKPYLELITSLGIRLPTRQNDVVDIEGLDRLCSYIEEEFKDELKPINDAMRLGMYDFGSLSEIYTPGSCVVAKNVFAAGVDMICEVSWNRYESGRTMFGVARTFRVCLQFVVAAGDHFTMCEFVESMESFEGQRHIKSLNFVPLFVYDTATASRLQMTCRDRGTMYARCATGANFLAYDKGSFYAKGGRSGGDRSAALRMSGRVMVDTQGGYEAGHSLGIASNDLMVTSIKYKYKEYMLHMRAVKQAKGGCGSDTAGGTTKDDVGTGMILFETVPDDYLEMTWPAVVGFSFTSKTWGEVLVDGLSEIEFDDAVFEILVLPAARKRMVKALVRHSNDSFNDIISGKGEGSVFLLYGPPGCGKTLTAEAISEMLHRPLYTVSLGQLGVTPAELETKLNEILDLCGRWDALVLLDEADIFLEKRSSTGSLERNAMVSVMLRLVEYFKGVLFLTSNRVDALDPAFKTRITLALRYDPLSHDARMTVWTNLLVLSGYAPSINDGTINVKSLAEHVLNGREIKNAIRLAMALAEEDCVPLDQTLLDETIDTLNDFNEKLKTAEAY